MATLEKIRSKSVFLIVVIGIALLAFIVGDALTNSRNLFGDHTTIAKTGKTKIDYTDYQRKREDLNNQLEEARRNNPEQMANFDTQLLPQMALDQLLQEGVIATAAQKAGVKSSSNILRYYMLEMGQSPEVMNIVRQLNAAGLAVQTPEQAYEIIFNPTRSGLTVAQMEPYQRLWLKAEQQMKKNIEANQYTRLVYGTVKANDLDKKALYNDYIQTSAVDVAFLPYGVLDAEKYPVSDADLKKMYDERKAFFAVQEPTKEVSFISVNIAPSAADRQHAHDLAVKTVKELSDSTHQVSKETKKEGVSVETRSLRASDIPAGAVKDYVTTAGANEVSLISENLQGFTVVKMGNRVVELDSIEISIVGVASAKLADQVKSALNSGLATDSLSKRFPADSVMAQPAQWVPLYTANGPTNIFPAAQLDSLLNASGYIALSGAGEGQMLAKVVNRKAPVTIYNYDVATYVLGPSLKTVNTERERLEKFLADNPTAKAFNENAAKAGYNIQNYDLTQSLPAIPRVQGMNQYYPDSRQVVRWVMIDGNEGDVSHIYESKNAVTPALYAVAVNAEYEDFVPMDNKEVREVLTRQARARKAGEAMQKEYSAKASSMDAVSKAMGVDVRNNPAFRFGRNNGVGDPEVTGKIAGNKGDKKVVVVAGNDGVYAYQVNGTKTENFPYTDNMYEQQYYQLVNPNMLEMIQGDSKVKNNIYKFEAGD